MLGATSRRDAGGRPAAVAGGAVLALLIAIGPLVPTAAAADPTPSPTPTATPAPTLSPPPFRLSLSRPGDFTRQYTAYQCVGASLQTMRNMIWSYNNRSPILQRRLWRIARAHSRYKADGGADPFGWTTATLLAGQGRYMLVAEPTLSQAAKAVARGIATTRRPAGIVVWHGTHAWVITGVEATADPATADAFSILTLKLSDPLWPYFHVRRRNVYRPGTRLTMSWIARNWTPYHDARRDPRLEGRYVAIVPIPDGAPLPAGARTPTSTPTPTPTPTPAPGGTPNPTASPTPTPTTAPAPTASPDASAGTDGSGEPTPSPSAAP